MNGKMKTINKDGKVTVLLHRVNTELIRSVKLMETISLSGSS